MTTLFKAVRPDGTDFFTGIVQWVPPAGHEGEWIVEHPTSTSIDDNYADTYLSVSITPSDCTSMKWPCRLLTVEPVGEVRSVDGMRNKRIGLAFQVTGERPAHEAFGPNGSAVVELLDRISRLSKTEAKRLAAAVSTDQEHAWWLARAAAASAGRSAASWAAQVANGSAVVYAAEAVVVRDLITPNQYATLTEPWAAVIGPAHPDDTQATK